MELTEQKIEVKKYAWKSNVPVVVFIIFIVGALSVLAYKNFIKDTKSGYFTYGHSCTNNTDCICSGVPGEFDNCGKPGQHPACVSGKCGWDYE